MASGKVSEVVNLLKTNQKTSELYVPSLKKTVKFKHLTAGQQEKFVQAIIDNPAVQGKFTSTLINVIKENCLDKNIINQITILDRYAIGIALRVASVGEVLKTEVESEPGVTFVIDLKENVEYIKKKVHSLVFEPITLDNVLIELQYPTITQEASTESYFRADSSFEQTPETIRNVISNAFIGEIAMFIKTLTYKKDEGEITLDFNQLTMQDKIEIVRSLPNTICEKLIDPMSKVKAQFESILKSTGTAETDSKVKRSILIAFDAALFVASN